MRKIKFILYKSVNYAILSLLMLFSSHGSDMKEKAKKRNSKEFEFISMEEYQKFSKTKKFRFFTNWLIESDFYHLKILDNDSIWNPNTIFTGIGCLAAAYPLLFRSKTPEYKLLNFLRKGDIINANKILDSNPIIDLNTSYISFFGKTPLMYSIRHQNTYLIRNLIERGANVGKRDYCFRNSFHHASRFNKFSIYDTICLSNTRNFIPKSLSKRTDRYIYFAYTTSSKILGHFLLSYNLVGLSAYLVNTFGELEWNDMEQISKMFCICSIVYLFPFACVLGYPHSHMMMFLNDTGINYKEEVEKNKNYLIEKINSMESEWLYINICNSIHVDNILDCVDNGKNAIELALDKKNRNAFLAFYDKAARDLDNDWYTDHVEKILSLCKEKNESTLYSSVLMDQIINQIMNQIFNNIPDEDLDFTVLPYNTRVKLE